VSNYHHGSKVVLVRGKYFKELCLIFGASSSAGIFDCMAKVVLQVACKLARFPRSQICQHLDDICAAAAVGSGDLARFDSVFQHLAQYVGVKLASIGTTLISHLRFARRGSYSVLNMTL
jgi:hypothetical protein